MGDNCGRSFKIPKIKSIFKLKRNSLENYPRINSLVEKLFEFSQMSSENFAKYSSYLVFTWHFHPMCDEWKFFRNLISFWILLLIVDDHTECDWGDVARNVDKGNEIFSQLISIEERILNKDKFISLTNWKPYSIYFYAVIEDICHNLNAVSAKRLLKNFTKYCENNIEENKKMEENYKFKDFLEMFQIRLHSSGCLPVFSLIEYADKATLTDEEWDEPIFKELIFMTALCLTYHNDIMSFEKEYKEQNGDLSRMYNAVALTAILDKCSIETSMEKCGQQYVKYEINTKEIMDKILETNISENKKIFIDRLQFMIGGNIHASAVTPRYNQF